MTVMNSVDIVMATFEGGRHLSSQLDSIFAQTFTNWRLTIRDDGSSDATNALIHNYLDRYPSKIRLITDDAGNLGPCANFNLLISQTAGDYVMLCDQDDVWLPNKIETTRQHMLVMEAQHGSRTPILIHTDAHVVDADLRLIRQSLWKSQHLNPASGSVLNRLLVQNIATGCTVMFNKALREAALPIPPEAVMHDWWLALTAAITGHIGHIDTPTVLYRQHHSNQIGAGIVNAKSFLHRIKHSQIVNDLLHRQRMQADAVFVRYGGQTNPTQNAILNAYRRLDANGFFRKRYNRIRFGFWYGGFFRNFCRLLLG